MKRAPFRMEGAWRATQLFRRVRPLQDKDENATSTALSNSFCVGLLYRRVMFMSACPTNSATGAKSARPDPKVREDMCRRTYGWVAYFTKFLGHVLYIRLKTGKPITNITSLRHGQDFI